jgi:hypothetical protein
LSDELLQTLLASIEHELEENLKILGRVASELQRRLDISTPRPTLRDGLEPQPRQDTEHASTSRTWPRLNLWRWLPHLAAAEALASARKALGEAMTFVATPPPASQRQPQPGTSKIG